jgi:hypothetical protein
MSKLQLKNISLLSYNCVDPMRSVKALRYSSKDIDFAELILVSHEKPEKLPSDIRFVKAKGTSYIDSTKFSYDGLPDTIKTDYYLGIHDDGFVINPHLWTDEFLQYDYIGAPWKWQGRRNRVGNGGFVLKSNKFIQLTRNLRYLGTHDDGELTNAYYDYFTANGCKYAPLLLAARFSLESRIPECEYNLNNCFGFHGRGDPKSVDVHDGFYHQFQEKCKLLDSVEI